MESAYGGGSGDKNGEEVEKVSTVSNAADLGASPLKAVAGKLPQAASILAKFGKADGAVVDGAKSVGKQIGKGAEVAFDTGKDVAKGAAEGAKNIVNGAADAGKNVAKSAKDVADGAADAGKSVVKNAGSVAKSTLSGMNGLLNGLESASGVGGGSASKPTVGHTSKPQGDQIPGGTSLYKTGSGMYHKGAPGAPDTYAFENTPAGIKFAADHNYASIDIDMHITKDGVPVATHWSQPMKKDGFHDPLGKLGKDTKVSDMTLAEVIRLRNEDGQSQIYPMATMIKHLKENGIAGDLEAKDDPRFATDQMMASLADLVRDAGIKANLKSIDRGSDSDKILKVAQDHGFWVRTAKGNGHEAREFGYGD